MIFCSNTYRVKGAKQYLDARQSGQTTVEFALISILFFVILLGVIELGRFVYLWNTAQEVTRIAAREAAVRWTVGSSGAANLDQVKTHALFGSDALPAGLEINRNNLNIKFLDKNRNIITEGYPTSPINNIDQCFADQPNCISFIQASINDATYVPMIGLFSGISVGAFHVDLRIPIPPSTVTMPAESMGYIP